MPDNARIAAFSAVLALAAAGCAPRTDKAAAINHYVRSQLLVDDGKVDAALIELSKAAEADPELSLVHAAMGDIQRRRGNYEAAAESYETACDLNPYAFRAHYNLGVTYQFLADAAETIGRVEELLRRATEVYLRATVIKPGDYDTNLNLSACYYQLGKYEQAEKYCRVALEIDQTAEAYSNLGMIHDAQNRLYDAVRAYKAALELDRHQPEVILSLGATYLRQERVKAALKAFQLAAKEDADAAAPHEQIGLCYVRLREFSEALKAYRTAVELNPESSTAYRGLGVVQMSRWLTHQEQDALRQEALEAWNRSLELKPDQPRLVKLVDKYTPKHTAPEL